MTKAGSGGGSPEPGLPAVARLVRWDLHTHLDDVACQVPAGSGRPCLAIGGVTRRSRRRRLQWSSGGDAWLAWPRPRPMGRPGSRCSSARRRWGGWFRAAFVRPDVVGGRRA